MNGNQPHLRSFLANARKFEAGSETPREFLEACLSAIEIMEPTVGAFVCIDAKSARAQADRSTGRWRAGKPLSPIDGMPIGVKDIMETVDMPTGQGSPLFEGQQTRRDAAAVAALRQAGAIIVGKTVTNEFAASEPRGTRNPWDLLRTPGGSSSGSAAAVGGGMLPVALGTQVIGSILRPASFCGCFGFKPSIGAINRGGSYDYSSQSCSGILAASLSEAWQVAHSIASRVGGDPGFLGLCGSQQPPPPQKPSAIAIVQTAGWGSATPSAREQLERIRDLLANAGVKVLTRFDDAKVAEIEKNLTDALALSLRITTWEGRWPLNAYAAHDAGKLSAVAQARLVTAEKMTIDGYRADLARRRHVRDIYQTLAADVRGVITLAAPGAAPIGLQSTGDPSFVVPFSLLGVPALSLPLLEDQGLPLGLQIAGFADKDAATFAVAAWIMQEFGEV